MRPLAVLILILGAVAALLFAVMSLTGSSDGVREVAHGREVIAAPPEQVPAAQLDPVQKPVSAADVEPESRSVVVVETAPGEEEITGAFDNWIEGTVVDPTGTPVVGAQVSLMAEAGMSRFADLIRAMNQTEPTTAYMTAATGTAGGFRFNRLKPGANWSVVVEHPDFARHEVGPITVLETGGTPVAVRLEEGFQLIGYVRDHGTGNPVPGAMLSLENPALLYMPADRRSPGDRIEVASDIDGKFVFRNVGMGQRALMCIAEGYATQIKYNLNFIGNEKRSVSQEFRMQPGTLIAGRVVGPDRAGIDGVSIDAVSMSNDPASRGSAISTSDGEFVINDIAEGLYTLKVTAEGWDVDPVLRVESGKTDVEITLYERGSVLGKVVDATTGRPLSEFTCRVRQVQKTNNAWGHETARRDFIGREDGSFELGGISEGTYVIQGDARGYASSFSERFTISQGLTTPDIVVPMTRGGTLKGRVIDSITGEPVANASITTNDNNFIQSEFTDFLQNLSPSALTRKKLTTDNDGRFELRLVTPETYQVAISANSYTQIVKNDVRVGDGLVTDLGTMKMSRGATVSGTVFGVDGNPAPGFDVNMARTDNRIWANLTARTDAQGRFTIVAASPGEYKLSASRPRGGVNNPFEKILDMKNSEVVLTLAEGQALVQDLWLAGE